MTEYRASFDASVSFSNGGDLAVHRFRVDVPSPDADEAGLAALFVASLGLLMTEAVELRNVTIVAEPHKGTRGGPAARGDSQPPPGGQLVELSHVIRPGIITYPGLPGLAITRVPDQVGLSRAVRPGAEFALDQLTMAGNTGTYLDAPYHRFPGGADLAAIPLARTAELPAAVVKVTGARQRGIGVGALAALDAAGRRCCSTPAMTPGSARRTTPRTRTS